MVVVKIKILQLNIFRGKFIDTIINYIKKNDFDIVHLQEVTTGKVSFNNISCPEHLHASFQNTHTMEYAKTWESAEDTNGSFGNATLYRNFFSLAQKKILRLKPFRKIPDFEKRHVDDDPRLALGLLLSYQEKRFWSLNTHLAWSPTSKDTPEKLSQGKKLVEFIKGINDPFILSGDFNVDTESQIISWLSLYGKNLIAENSLTNTLNPRTHYAKSLFPMGVAVDFIFTAHKIRVENFQVIDEPDLSDHFGLSATLSL